MCNKCYKSVTSVTEVLQECCGRGQTGRRMAALELKAEAARLKADSIAQDSGRGRDSGTRISSSLASVGGGGRSILIGGPLVAEGKKHTRLLEAIRAATSKPPTVQVSGNVDAVIGR